LDRGRRPTTRFHPTAPERSNLNYLASGDWHSVLEIDSRSWYVETPETDRFQHDVRGTSCSFIFGLEGPGVNPIQTGRYQWLTLEWRVNDTASFDAELERIMSEVDPAAELIRLSLVRDHRHEIASPFSTGSNLICDTALPSRSPRRRSSRQAE
jgi:hypothetical protein